ncbi:hypothetical protein GCM10009560_67880 [Nonomuraea longicatena]|uniref:Novel STAND NTPase 1 domain-containing protein n=2 Tax=Nonomuraea longicatena TaxID=83682 RepID=A0ABP4BHH9_9ACTN
MRAGVRARVARLARTTAAGTRRWTPPALLAILSAGAFGAFLEPEAATAGAALLGAVSAVGGNILTDLVTSGIAKLGGDTAARQEIETELERRIRHVLDSGGAEAQALRAELAVLLREIGAVGAAVEAAIEAGDRDLQEHLARGLAGLGEEFAFALTEVEGRLQALREGQDEQGARLDLVVGLQYRQATDTRLLLQLVSELSQVPRPAVGAGRCPYRGLVPFTEADAEVFHGREQITAELVTHLSRRLAAPGLALVTGASGAGKSSLLRAGLLPAIGRGELTPAARDWPVQVLDQPTSAPLARLATGLAALAGLPAPDVVRCLREDPRQTPSLVRQAVEADARRRALPLSSAARLVLIVDQFEEVFTLAGESEAAAFVAALHAAATVPAGGGGAPAALVVIAVRGDFADRCAAHPHLAAALRGGPFVVGPMGEADLRRAITGPADTAGLLIESGLIDTILSELRAPGGGYAAGVLPLLSQTMSTVWEHRDGDRLTARGYARTGGVTQAVASSAEAAYHDLPPARREAARRVFERLATVTRDGVPARRTAALTGDPASAEVLESFARRRLVVVDADSAQLAHDVLLGSWPRLRAWLATERSDRVLHAELLQDAADWEQHERDPSFLYRGVRLEGAEEAVARWRADLRRYAGFDLPASAGEFLRTSARAAGRARRRRRNVTAALSGLLVVAVVTAVAAVRFGQEADWRRSQASSREAAAHSRSLTHDPGTAARLAAAAWAVGRTNEARASMAALLSRPGRRALSGHAGEVGAVTFSPSGDRLATGSTDKTVRVWEVATGRQVTFAGHTDMVFSVAFSPSGAHLASAGYDRTVRIWDTATGRPVGEPLRHPDVVFSVAFSPSGRSLATAGYDGKIRIWDLATRRHVTLTGYGERVRALAYSPSGDRLASGDEDGTVHLWDVATGRRIGSLDHSGIVWSLAFSPSGASLATAGQGRRVRLWDLATMRATTALTGHTDWVSAVDFSPSGDRLASAGWDSTVRLWDVATGRQLGAPLTGHTDVAVAVAFSPSGDRLASGGADRTVRLWDTAVGRQVGAALDHTDLVETVAFGPAGRSVASGGYDGKIRIWDLATRRHVTLAGHTDWVHSLAYGPSGDRLASASRDGTVRLWDLTARKQLGSLKHPDSMVSTAFSPDGTRLAGGSRDGMVRLWDTATLRPIGEPLTGHDGPVRSVAFSPDGRLLATSGDDGTVRLWSTGALGRTLIGHVNAVTSVAFSPSGERLASGGDDKTVRVWDVATGRQLGPPLTGHTGEVTSVAFSPSGDRLASGGRDKTVRLWDVATGRPLGVPLTGHTGQVASVAFSPSGDRLAGGGHDGTVRFWAVALPSDLLKAVCDIAGRPFTPQEWKQYVAGEPYRPGCP